PCARPPVHAPRQRAAGRRFVQEWAQERQEGVRRPAPRFLCWSGALCEALGGRVAYEPPLDELVPAGELVATLAGRTPLEGVNRSEWRGLTCYRFPRPQTPPWDEGRALSPCLVRPGRRGG